jgi:carbon monoxide dehydrogenase subunit G
MKEPGFATVRIHEDALVSAIDMTSEKFFLNSVGGTMELIWTADTVVVGKIASIASRMMGSVARRLTNRFFKYVE